MPERSCLDCRWANINPTGSGNSWCTLCREELQKRLKAATPKSLWAWWNGKAIDDATKYSSIGIDADKPFTDCPTWEARLNFPAPAPEVPE